MTAHECSREELPHIQGKEQQLSFAGAAVKRPQDQGKRYPSKTVGVSRGHQKADRLKPNHRKLVNLITWTTVFSNSTKLSHAMWGHPRWWSHGGEV